MESGGPEGVEEVAQEVALEGLFPVFLATKPPPSIHGEINGTVRALPGVIMPRRLQHPRQGDFSNTHLFLTRHIASVPTDRNVGFVMSQFHRCPREKSVRTLLGGLDRPPARL